MPRFSIKDLFIATTLVAVGMGMILLMPDSPNDLDVVGYGPIAGAGAGWFVIAALAVIGAGLGTPFHRPFIGAIAFVVFAVVSIILWAVLWF